MDFTTLTIDILKTLSIFGGYGIGIILLTIIIRAAMWPLGVSQQRSMRTMQMLQPKMKAIQERYKSDPQKMQQTVTLRPHIYISLWYPHTESLQSSRPTKSHWRSFG